MKISRLVYIFVIFIHIADVSFAWTQVQGASNGGFTGQAGAGVSFGVAATAGNLVVCHWFFQSTTVTLDSVTDAGGDSVWNIRGSVTGSDNRSYIADAVVATAFSSPNGTFSGATTGDVFCEEYSGNAAAGSQFDCISSGGSGTGTNLSGGSCTPSASDDLIIGAGGTMANSVTYTAGAGFTVRDQESHSTQGNSAAIEDKFASSCSASSDMTGSGSGTWNMITAAYKSSSPGACGASLPPGNILTRAGSGSISTRSGSGSIQSR